MELSDLHGVRVTKTLQLDCARLTASRFGVTIKLPKNEWLIFFLLCESINQPVTVDEVVARVFDLKHRARPDAQAHNTIKKLRDRLAVLPGVRIEMRNLHSKKRRTAYVLRLAPAT